MEDLSNSSSTRFSRLTPSPQSCISVDSESDSSDKQTASRSSKLTTGMENSGNISGLTRSESTKSLSSLIEINTAEDLSRNELKKLNLDQNGTFMADFDPEKSQREMRKMNRRIFSKEAKKNQLYDGEGVLLETSVDLCDCLDKDCIGCHLPCQRCGSNKCGTDCRCNRKYIVDFIEVEGTETFYSFPV